MKAPAHALRSAAATAVSALMLFTLSGVVHDPTAAALGGTPTQVAPVAVTVALDKPVNFRDALATGGRVSITAVAGSPELKDGVLWRSGKLAKASAADRQRLTSLLAGGTIIDLRTKSVAKGSPDPTLPGVTRLAIPLSAGSYSKFVSDSARRKAIATAIRTVAYARGPVLVHCTYGRDRTGWTIAMIYFALGFPESVVRAEYLKSSGATNAKLNSGLNQAVRQYGSVRGYLVNGLGLSDATFAALRAKLTA